MRVHETNDYRRGVGAVVGLRKIKGRATRRVERSEKEQGTETKNNLGG